MKIIRVKKIKIDEIVRLLKKGGVVVLPTETAYGLSCDFKNKKAKKKIYEIKGRPKHKPLLIMAADIKMVEKIFIMSPEEKKLAKKYWPGPLSIILRAKKGSWTGKLGRVRVPDNNLCRAISKKFGWPIITTSANFSGGKTPYSISAVLKEFAGKKYLPDLIVDAGRLKRVKPSTLIKVRKGKVVVLRQGPIII